MHTGTLELLNTLPSLNPFVTIIYNINSPFDYFMQFALDGRLQYFKVTGLC